MENKNTLCLIAFLLIIMFFGKSNTFEGYRGIWGRWRNWYRRKVMECIQNRRTCNGSQCRSEYMQCRRGLNREYRDRVRLFNELRREAQKAKTLTLKQARIAANAIEVSSAKSRELCEKEADEAIKNARDEESTTRKEAYKIFQESNRTSWEQATSVDDPKLHIQEIRTR